MRKASLKSTLDLEKKRRIFKEISSEDSDVPVALEYDKGHINDYRLGTAHVKGYLLLTLPLGHYKTLPESSIFQCESFMEEWAIKNFLLQEDTAFYRNFINSPFQPAYYSASMLQPGSREMEIYLKFLSWNYCMDDFLDESIASSSNSVSGHNLGTLKEEIEKILSGMYTSKKDIAQMEVEFFKEACNALFEITEEIKEITPSYSQAILYFKQCVVNWLSSISLFAGLMAKNWQCDMCYLQVRLENGQRCLFELITVLTKTWIKHDIRESLPFKIFYDAGDYAINLVNDIFCLEKELNAGEFSCNMILRKSVLKKMSLQMAMDLCRDMVNDAMSDMAQAARDLIEIYPEDDHVIQFVKNYQSFVDGNMYLVVENTKKYGKCKYTLKKVFYEDCIF